MTTEGVDKLVMMANQIAAFFAAQPDDPAAGVAGHIRAFWSPPMRQKIIAHAQAGGAGLSPVALGGVERLRDLAAKAR